MRASTKTNLTNLWEPEMPEMIEEDGFVTVHPPHPTARRAILQEADTLIHGDRQKHYGPPEENFRRIGVRWSQFLGVEIEPWQVCVMMADLKIARLAEGPHRDSMVDGCGYLALAGELGL